MYKRVIQNSSSRPREVKSENINSELSVHCGCKLNHGCLPKRTKVQVQLYIEYSDIMIDIWIHELSATPKQCSSDCSPCRGRINERIKELHSVRYSSWHVATTGATKCTRCGVGSYSSSNGMQLLWEQNFFLCIEYKHQKTFMILFCMQTKKVDMRGNWKTWSSLAAGSSTCTACFAGTFNDSTG